MKQIWKPLLLLTALTALLSVPALAADTGTGFYAIPTDQDVTITVNKPDDAERLRVTWNDDTSDKKPIYTFYDGADSLKVEFNAASAGYYLVVVSTAETIAVNEQTLIYIDQQTLESAGGKVTFEKVYPKALANDGLATVYLHIISNQSDFGENGVKTLPLKYAQNAAYEIPAYIPGDADSDEEVSSMDAVWILQYNVDILTDYQRTKFNEDAANVDGDDEVSSMDAVWILQYVVDLRDSNFNYIGEAD